MPPPLRVPGIATMPLWLQQPPLATPQPPGPQPPARAGVGAAAYPPPPQLEQPPAPQPPSPQPVLHVSQPPPQPLSQPQPVSQPQVSQPPQGAHSLQQNIFSRQQHPVLLATAIAAVIANIKLLMGRKILSSELLGSPVWKVPSSQPHSSLPPVYFKRFCGRNERETRTSHQHEPDHELA